MNDLVTGNDLTRFMGALVTKNKPSRPKIRTTYSGKPGKKEKPITFTNKTKVRFVK